MKHLVERIISAVLAAALVFCTAFPVWADDDATGIFIGVNLSAVLDNDTITESNIDQTVVLTIKTSKPVTLTSFNMNVVEDESVKVESVSGASEKIYLQSDNYNRGEIEWNISNGAVENVTNLIAISFIVPANTKVGTYELGVNYVALSYDGDYFESGERVCATLTIIEAPKTAGYTAGVTAVTKEITVADKAEVAVSVSHATDKNFAAGEIVLQYDSTMLTFDKETSSIGTAQVKDVDGVLTLEDYGEEKTLGDSVYKLVFTPTKDGPATVTLKSAAFVNKTDAAKSDLIPAAISPETVQFPIGKRRYKVTMDKALFTGLSEVEEGTSYTFTATDPKNYTYENVTATMGDEPTTVKDNSDDTYTIADVRGDVYISGNRTPKSYDVTFAGGAAGEFEDAVKTATYGTDYSFTMPTSDEYAYSVGKITIGGEEYKGYTVAKDKPIYTIPGTAITGEICVTVNKTRTAVKVDVNGDGAGAAAGNTVIAKLGEDYVLTLTPEAGYNYTVTATMDGKNVTLIQDENTYKIEKVTGSIAFIITRTVITDDVSVKKYLGVNEKNVWLVLKTTKLADEKVPTYGEENMFWSDKYEAYCYLVMTKTLTEDNAEKQIGIIDGTTKTVDYGMDVNMTDKVDASDAQLVYNMYNADYSAFTDDMTMEKFLRADVNGDKEVNTEDAVAIVRAILNKSVPQ